MKFKIHLFILLINTFYCFSQTPSGDDGLFFNGISDGIIDITSNTINEQITINRTYELSFKVVDATLATKQYIMAEGGGSRGMSIYIENGYIHLGAYNIPGTGALLQDPYEWAGTFFREPISSDTWYHIAIVLDNAPVGDTNVSDGTTPPSVGDNTALKWYLDGNLMGELTGLRIYQRNDLTLGYKDNPTRTANCGTWTTTGNSEYCFNNSFRESSTDEYFFNGYIYGFRAWDDVRTATELKDNIPNIITTIGTDDLIVFLNGRGVTFENNDGDIETTTPTTTDPDIMWKAASNNTNWNDGTNWEGGNVPDNTQQETVIIQASTNNPILSTHATIGNITIQSGAELTINSGGTLESNLDITNNGNVVVENGGSLLLKQTQTISGAYNIKKTTPTYSSNEFFSYWSSPVTAANSNVATVFPDAEVIYSFDASSADSEWIIHGTANFESGVGYAIQNEGNGGQVRTFTGNINNGNIAVNVYNTTNATGTDNNGTSWSTSGDNLVGNPYPSAIDWNLVVADTDNSSIDGTMYLWDQTSAEPGYNNVSDYKQYNLTGGSDNTTTSNIASGQGFFIRTSADNQITFKASHQVAGENTSFFKTTNTDIDKKGRSWFSIKKDQRINTLLVGFIENATDNYDRLYDAPFDTNETSLGFYTLLENNKKASIQGLPELTTNTKTVRLGYHVDQTGEYNISIQKEFIDENYAILLEDTKNNLIVNLKETDYIFNVSSIGENNSRFNLIYKQEGSLSLNNNYTTNYLLAYINSNKELIVKYNSKNEAIKEIEVYNIYGNSIIVFDNKKTNDVSSLTQGMYILNITLTNNSHITKKILIN